MSPFSRIEVVGTTSLERVRELNYDHHRRMTEIHLFNVAAGIQQGQSKLDDESYLTLLSSVPRGNGTIVELGSASGGQWHILKEWGSHILGVDLYEPAVKEAHTRGLPIFLGFVEDMSFFKDECADLVCSRHVMEHLGHVDRGIREIKRILKIGGYTAHVTPDMPGDTEPAHLNRWSKGAWAGKWQEHGFELRKVEKLPFHGGETHIVCQKVDNGNT